MALAYPAVAEGARILARQTISSALSLPSTDPASGTPTSSAPPANQTAPPSSPTDTNTSTGGGSNSSPLLFFVALGFGVVFTNLWIIVGVKYCFRYNARNRQLRLNEDGEPINMDNIQRPHRRRREKKLMTIDEVNGKFPMMKYKTWVASRAHEGLPTSGGVTAPPSRPASMRSLQGIIPESIPETKERVPIDGSGLGARDGTSIDKDNPSPTGDDHPTAPADGLGEAFSQISHDEDDEDAHINPALPPECIGTSGDTCAICIDSLEDDDDVRGLSCGHAFHAVCLDPWLTSRRACCPLCKADYYTPKPRPAPAESGDGTGTVIAVSFGDHRHGRGMNMPTRPSPSRLNLRSATRRIIPGLAGAEQHPSQPASSHHGGFMSRFRQRTNTSAEPSSNAPAQLPIQHGSGMMSNIRSGLSGLLPCRRGNAQRNPSQATVTQSQLEAGVRN